MKPLVLGLAFGALFATGSFAQETGTASAIFIDGQGGQNGSASLLETPNGVLIQVEVGGLPANQWVGFHVHEAGECDPATDHESTGEHFNPTDVEHGYLTETGPHAGDMPNQFVSADGNLRAEVFNPLVTLDGGNASILGRALMVHAGADDYETQPSGDAGDRLACAVIE